MPDEQKPVTAVITEEQAAEAAKENRAPRCGFCGMDPIRLHIDDEMNPMPDLTYLVTRTIICQNCRAIHGVSVVGQKRMDTDPRAQNPTQVSKIRIM